MNLMLFKTHFLLLLKQFNIVPASLMILLVCMTELRGEKYWFYVLNWSRDLVTDVYLSHVFKQRITDFYSSAFVKRCQ